MEDDPMDTAAAEGESLPGEPEVVEEEEIDFGSVELIEVDIAALQRERDDYLATSQRLQADFENYKKRVARQQVDLVQQAARGLVTKLLPALDTLNLAIEHASVEGGSPEAATALAQVAAGLNEVLGKEGLEVIEPIGKQFDPEEADAVIHDGGEGEPLVTEVMRVGYRWRGQTIRAAMVRVAGS
ncbi:MAG: nucleotide exchange factor GrpE [Ferrimicrobium sp.]